MSIILWLLKEWLIGLIIVNGIYIERYFFFFVLRLNLIKSRFSVVGSYSVEVENEDNIEVSIVKEKKGE